MTTLHLSAPEDEDEARMRRALGTHEGGRSRQDSHHGPRPARQFAQDGDVPVVRLRGRKDPALLAAAKLDEALQTERTAREQAETALRQANATIHALQTKIAHAEIAYAEAIATERRAADLARADLARVEAQVEQERAEQEAASARPTTHHKPALAPVETSPADRSGDMSANVTEPEPVQWWVPGWRKGMIR